MERTWGFGALEVYLLGTICHPGWDLENIVAKDEVEPPTPSFFSVEEHGGGGGSRAT